MVLITPGVDFLAQGFCMFVGFGGFVATSLFYLARRTGYGDGPTWLLLVACTRPRFHYNMEAVLGTGVFNSVGEMWKFHRSITCPMFTREKISHFDLFDRRAQQAIDKLRQRLREGYAVDFQDLMSRFTLDSVFGVYDTDARIWGVLMITRIVLIAVSFLAAEEFDPDRFLDERLKKYVSKNPFIFLPFNAGPCICLGQQFAYEMSFMIIRLYGAVCLVR